MLRKVNVLYLSGPFRAAFMLSCDKPNRIPLFDRCSMISSSIANNQSDWIRMLCYVGVKKIELQEKEKGTSIYRIMCFDHVTQFETILDQNCQSYPNASL